MLGNVCIRSSRMKEAWPAAPATKHKANVLCFCHLFLGNSSTTATCPKHTPYCSCLHELNTAGRAPCSPGNAGATFPYGLPHWSFSVPTANPCSGENKSSKPHSWTCPALLLRRACSGCSRSSTEASIHQVSTRTAIMEGYPCTGHRDVTGC